MMRIMSKETKEIEIPEELYLELLEKMKQDENYNSVEDLVVDLLKNLISKEEKNKKCD